MSNPTLESVTEYAYEEWQIAEGDGEMAGNTEDASYHIGQADAFRDVFGSGPLRDVTGFGKRCAHHADGPERHRGHAVATMRLTAATWSAVSCHPAAAAFAAI